MPLRLRLRLLRTALGSLPLDVVRVPEVDGTVAVRTREVDGTAEVRTPEVDGTVEEGGTVRTPTAAVPAGTVTGALEPTPTAPVIVAVELVGNNALSIAPT